MECSYSERKLLVFSTAGECRSWRVSSLVLSAGGEVGGPVALGVGGPFLGGVDAEVEEAGEDGDGQFAGEGDERANATGAAGDAVLEEVVVECLCGGGPARAPPGNSQVCCVPRVSTDRAWDFVGNVISCCALGVVVGAPLLAALLRYVPAVAAHPDASPQRELAGARNQDLWLTLAVGAIGGGDLFAVYSYLAPTWNTSPPYRQPPSPIFLAIWSVGMIASLAATTALLILFTATSRHPITAALTVFAVATSSRSLVPVLQTRLMDVAGQAQSLAAALNHSAFNVANALGAYLGGLAIATGFGWTSPQHDVD